MPVVVYIAPAQTQAGASGSFLLSASHIAAMAPDTSFGSADPLVQTEAFQREETRDVVRDGVIEQLTDWNAQHGRNTDWISEAVQDGMIITNEQAVAMQPPAITLVARDQDDLMTRLEGQVVTLSNGETVTLTTLGRQPVPIEANLLEQLLLFLADPTILFILLVLGGMALYSELVSGGVGILAAMAMLFLLGALYGILVLPIRWISLVGLLLAFGCIIADLFVPSHGGLSVVGLVLMIISSLTLIDTAQAPGVFVAIWAILMVVLLVAAFIAVSIWLILRSGKRPVSTGQEGLIGQLAEVRERLQPTGMVFVEGALWKATTEDGSEVESGEWVRIISNHKLLLVVCRIDSEIEAINPNRPD